MYDVIIIGAGPAGLTAAIYTSRARLKTLVIASASIMSQTGYAYWIENYPGFPEGIGGAELIANFHKQAKKTGAEFVDGSVDSIVPGNDDTWQVISGDIRYEAISVIIASGAKTKKLEIDGEKRLYGRGVSYCATCDGAFFKNKDIVVVGGGDTAAEEALFLTRFAKKVMLIHRRDKLRAAKILQEKVLSNKRIEVIWNSTVERISGEKKVEAVAVKNIKEGNEKDISCEGIFISIGFMPNTDFAKGLLNMNKNGLIITDTLLNTSTKGIFACGDCRNTPLKQIVTAAGNGALAALSAQEYVEKDSVN